MVSVFLKYNPFTVETSVSINGEEVTFSKLMSKRHERLQAWLDELFPILAEECNDDIELTFQGTQLDYEDIEMSAKEYEESHGKIRIHLKQVVVKDSYDRIKELITLFEYLQKECPFEDLKDKQIQDNFHNAVGSEFEVSVIATMSSGKSTLINAMLGRELMPAKNEACTATIAKIKDVDGMTDFSAVCRDLDNKEIVRTNQLTLQEMDKYNEDPKIAFIDIEGDIPFVSSKNMELVLLDTPGPNNSRTEAHKNHTYRIIKEKSKPMVLYVLNATQLSTNDDNYLLASVADAMKVGGKQAKDRFIFAVNKVDTFDIEKGESIEGALGNVRAYLAQHGIEKPNVYPISAEMAKVIRLNESGVELTRKQRKTISEYDNFNEVPQMHLTQYAPLSIRNREVLDGQLLKARKENNEYAEALIHTGVPAIEIAINEYLDKYALTNKVKTAVDTFRKKIEQKELVGKLMGELQSNTESRENLKNRLQFIEKQLEDGKKANQFKARIEKLDIESQASSRIRPIMAKITKVLDAQGTVQVGTSMSPLQVQSLIMRLQRDVGNLQSDIKTDLDKLIDEVVIENANAVLNEYKSHIRSLIDDNTLQAAGFSSTATIQLFVDDAPDADELITQFKQTESVKVGEQWVENTNKRWYKPWTWFDDEGYYKSIYETREYVDGAKVIESYFKPISRNFHDNIENAKATACAEADKFKQFFMGELDKLNIALQRKVAELKEVSGNEAALAARIKADEEKMRWIKNFLQKLDQILEV